MKNLKRIEPSGRLFVRVVFSHDFGYYTPKNDDILITYDNINEDQLYGLDVYGVVHGLVTKHSGDLYHFITYSVDERDIYTMIESGMTPIDAFKMFVL